MGNIMKGIHFKLASGVGFAVLLAACGGSTTDTSNAASGAARLLSESVSAGTDSAAITEAAASHFLAQATFGANSASITEAASMGKAAWLKAEFAKRRSLHRDYMRNIAATGYKVTQDQFYESFWQQAIVGKDQLRQRMKFALSQIFVVSFVDANLSARPISVGDYYDTLGQHAFGNFRDLLQAVALHPTMGLYLSHLHNMKENGTRVADENFAREVMQLMTIGVYQLNQDGTVKTDNQGKPLETYTHDDVAGLAKVLTGWSWNGPDRSDQRFFGSLAAENREWLPMQMYPSYHSTSSKTFLGVSTNGSGEADLKVALDTLFNHPNVGPFIGRQLIQRLVSSNPSPAYIGRVAAAFANNGGGVRGDMQAVIRAILLDPEAADTGRPKKLREPVLRLSNWLRAFSGTSTSGRFLVSMMDDPLSTIGQTPLRSPSVFNFFRPTYTPPNTTLAAAGMEAPEMQLVSEPSVTGYLNFMRSVIPEGLGTNQDIQANYYKELELIATPEALVDRVKLLLYAGNMSTTLRSQIVSAVSAVPLPRLTATNGPEVLAARKNRVYMTVYLAMASPEYLAQR